MRKATILHLITELDTGGAQVALLRLLAKMNRGRFSLCVACLYNGEAEVARRIRDLGIPVFDLGMSAKWHLDAFAHLYLLLRSQKPHILHTWMFHANLPGRILGRLAGVPIVISSERTMGMESRLRRWLNRLTAPLVDRIVCVSERVADFAAHEIGLPWEKLVIIPNGVSLEAFAELPSQEQARLRLGLPTGSHLIGSIGRAHPVKGLSVLLEAFVNLIPEYPSAYLAIAGDGPQLSELQAQAARLKLRDRVAFLGYCPHIVSLLAAMDIFALPSIHEGLPNALLEAMAAGRPVVATPVGGVPEAVVDGGTGLLVPPGDAEALASALARLLSDPDLRANLGQAGQQRVRERFSLDEKIRKTEELYEALLMERGSL